MKRKKVKKKGSQTNRSTRYPCCISALGGLQGACRMTSAAKVTFFINLAT